MKRNHSARGPDSPTAGSEHAQTKDPTRGRGPRLWVGLLAASLALTGCASVSGYPQRTAEVDARLTSLQDGYFLPKTDVLAAYRGLTDPDARRAYRNEVVRARMMAIDLQFSVFREHIYEEGAVSNLGLDILGLAAGAAGAITTGAGASRILSALSGGITGADSAINENLYYERTMPALLALMEAERDKVRADIEQGLQQEDIAYELGQGLIDLERYFQVGSIPGAIASVTETAGETSAQAKADLNVVRTAAFVNAKAQERATNALGLVDTLKDGKALEILATPPTEIDSETENLVRLRLGNRSLEEAKDSLTDDSAKAILKMVVVNLADRSEDGLGKWVTLMQSNQQ